MFRFCFCVDGFLLFWAVALPVLLFSFCLSLNFIGLLMNTSYLTRKKQKLSNIYVPVFSSMIIIIFDIVVSNVFSVTFSFSDGSCLQHFLFVFLILKVRSYHCGKSSFFTVERVSKKMN